MQEGLPEVPGSSSFGAPEQADDHPWAGNVHLHPTQLAGTKTGAKTANGLKPLALPEAFESRSSAEPVSRGAARRGGRASECRLLFDVANDALHRAVSHVGRFPECLHLRMAFGIGTSRRIVAERH